MKNRTIARLGGLGSAILVAIITFAVAAHAVQSYSAPNELTFLYSLASGGNSNPITPTANVPTLVIGAQTTTGNVGSSEMTVINSASNQNELIWNGIESNAGGFSAGSSGIAGHHMIFIDNNHCVDLEVNSATTLKVHNACSATQAVSVSEIW